MALTREDLQAIADLMDSKLEPINKRLETLESGQVAMMDDIAEMNGGIAALKADMAHHNHYIEPLLNTINEGITGMIEKHERLDIVEDKVENHDHRIFALEQVVGE